MSRQLSRCFGARIRAALSCWLSIGLATAQDPEATPAGRTQFLGREIAQTMHWTGAAWLLRATREAEENGAALRRWLAVPAGHRIADLGCGNGYHTLPLAREVGAGGTVYAVELQPQYLVMLRQRADAADLDNIVGIEATIDDPSLPPASCDLVLMVDVYHELSHPMRVMQKVRQALRPGGRVVLVEFRAEDPEVPIKPEHTMSKAQVLLEMAWHGFELATEHDALPWQHAMAFVPAAADARLPQRALVGGLRRAMVVGDARVVQPFVDDEAPPPALAAPGVPAELQAGPNGSVVAAVGDQMVEIAADDGGRLRVARGPLQPWRRTHGSTRPFVVMHPAMRGADVERQAALAHELGFDGVSGELAELPALRLACERLDVDVFSAYAVLTLPAADAPPEQLAARLQPIEQALRALAGGPGMLWLAINRDGMAPRDPAGDAALRTTLQRLLPLAAATGVEIALYPHHAFWLETADDALRVLAAIDDGKLGVCFNLCHELRAAPGVDPRPALRRCGARLFAVTLNGADLAGADWDTLIRPLDEGDHALAPFLAELDAIGFRGPVGLQGYGITLPPREHLVRSMAAWRRVHDEQRGPK